VEQEAQRRAVEKPIVGRVIKKTVVKGNRNCDANVMESYLRKSPPWGTLICHRFLFMDQIKN